VHSDDLRERSVLCCEAGACWALGDDALKMPFLRIGSESLKSVFLLFLEVHHFLMLD